jgi:hypothetical protein
MTSGWISFNEKTFKRLIYDNKTVTSCSNVGCKVDDFSISEKDEDVKDYSGEDGGDGESDGDGEGEEDDGEDDYEGYGEDEEEPIKRV